MIKIQIVVENCESCGGIHCFTNVWDVILYRAWKNLGKKWGWETTVSYKCNVTKKYVESKHILKDYT